VTALAPLWDDMWVKHTWDAIPANWESLGPPPTGTTVEPRCENAFIDALYEASGSQPFKVRPHHSSTGACTRMSYSDLVMAHTWIDSWPALLHTPCFYHRMPRRDFQ
jgi:hypothetical protein